MTEASLTKTAFLIQDNLSGQEKYLAPEAHYILPEKTNPANLPPEIQELAQTSFRAESWSMFPTIWKGDKLKVDFESPENIIPGDIILY